MYPDWLQHKEADRDMYASYISLSAQDVTINQLISHQQVNKWTHSRNTLRQTTRDPQNQFLLSDVLLIRMYLIYVHCTANQIMLKN